jgi:hypothetical protein
MKISEDALSLVKSIGLPGLVEGEAPPLNKALSLLQLAKLNKTPLLYLESLRKLRRHLPLEAQLSRYRDKHGKTLDLTALVSSLFEESSIPHAIFKTLKPFPCTPADVDILLRSKRDLTKASQILEKKGLKPLDRHFHGLTMFSVSHGVNVDLTTEVAASSFIYLDKSLLFEHITRVKVNSFRVQTLQPHADLVAVAAHSLYKEHMYTASDYYTFALSSQYYQEALKLAKSTHTKLALETALKLTRDITINAFGPSNPLARRLQSLFRSAGTVNAAAPTNRSLDLPVRHTPHLLMRGLLEKILEDPTSRGSLLSALKSAFNPRFFIKLSEHATRKGY